MKLERQHQVGMGGFLERMFQVVRRPRGRAGTLKTSGPPGGSHWGVFFGQHRMGGRVKNHFSFY